MLSLKTSKVALGALLALGLLAAVPAAVMAAQPSCGQTLTTNTTLTADLDCSGYGGTALYMGAPDVVLNLNGHTIWGNTGSNSYYGVDTNDYNRTTIKNGSLNNFGSGVYLDSSNRTLVQNLEISGQIDNDYGVYATYGVKNTLNDLDVHDVTTGVYAEYGASLTVKNSNLSGDPNDSNNGIGLYLYYQTGDSVSGNHFHGYYGVSDYYSHRQTYTGNTSNDNEYGFYNYCDGYGIVNMSGNTAIGNGSYGFYLFECYAVDHPVDGFTGSKVTGNTANENGTGFYSYYSFNEAWKSNTANDNDNDGFNLDYPSGAVITFNVARRNADSGIELQDNYSLYNVRSLNYNTAKKNAYGLYAGYGVADATGNIVAMNTSQNCYNVDC